jgi:hypothetical protein
MVLFTYAATLLCVKRAQYFESRTPPHPPEQYLANTSNNTARAELYSATHQMVLEVLEVLALNSKNILRFRARTRGKQYLSTAPAHHTLQPLGTGLDMFLHHH